MSVTPILTFADLPLAVRIEVARAARTPMVFAGTALEELHQTMVAAREVERAFSERSIAIADAFAYAEHQARLAQAWSRAALAAAVLALAAQLGALLS